MSWWQGLIAAAQGAATIMGAERSNSLHRRIAAREREHQKEFAQHGIRWRVEDAKAAGLHPLAALGAQVPSYSPVMYQDAVGPAWAEAGQNIGNAILRTQTSAQRRAEELSLRLLEAQVDETDARKLLALSEARRNLQDMAASAPAPPAKLNVTREGTLDWALSRFPQASSGIGIGEAPGVEVPDTRWRADTHGEVGPFWREFHMGKGRLVLPTTSDDPAEALESVNESAILMWAVYMENRDRYGQAWADEMARRYFVPDLWYQTKEKFKKYWRRGKEGVKDAVDAYLEYTKQADKFPSP